jgi:hypothetical protein
MVLRWVASLQRAPRLNEVEGAGEVLKSGICEFPSVFECSRVLNLAINAH